MKALLLTVESFDRHMVNQKFLKYKPLKGVSKDPRAWWRYAISAVLEEDVMRKTKMWSWKHIKKHRCGTISQLIIVCKCGSSIIKWNKMRSICEPVLLFDMFLC